VSSFLKNQFPLVVWLALIFWLSSISRVPDLPQIPHLDKVAHASLYFILGWFGHRAFRNQERFPGLRRHAMLAAFILSAVYAFSDEYHQRFVPGRTYDYWDMAADAIGASIYLGLYWLSQRRSSSAKAS
jgi:VanZ family protein